MKKEVREEKKQTSPLSSTSPVRQPHLIQRRKTVKQKQGQTCPLCHPPTPLLATKASHVSAEEMPSGHSRVRRSSRGLKTPSPKGAQPGARPNTRGAVWCSCHRQKSASKHTSHHGYFKFRLEMTEAGSGQIKKSMCKISSNNSFLT